MKEIYLLSGLGADNRVFDFIDLSEFKVNFINWIEPLDDESIGDYAFRISRQITTEKPLLIGVSFGGMMAVEIGKHINTERIVLISSVKTKNDLPAFYKFIGLMHLNKLVPASVLKSANPLVYWFFGVSSLGDKKLLKLIIKDTDVSFMKWAIDKILNWNNVEIGNVLTIHGTADRILPIRKPDFIIEEGGHFMIVNKAKQITNILKMCIR